MEMLETEFAIYARLGMLAEVRIYNLTKIVESRNAKFLEYDLVNGSNQFRNIVSDIDHIKSQPSTSVINCLLFINPQVQTGIEQTIVKFNQSLKTNQSLKFHKLLTTFQYIKLIGVA
ncbi:hypothetical protein CK203_035108 [Vitis vinifera]|uniref:Uncharacterized protein n=1 Tax=Vitis vinifera TaxID=29760 RepID=A0A438I9M1_VITVI|nr:hypothetical protein CK203_035108 [Vitis vinifera]